LDRGLARELKIKIDKEQDKELYRGSARELKIKIDKEQDKELDKKLDTESSQYTHYNKQNRHTGRQTEGNRQIGRQADTQTYLTMH